MDLEGFLNGYITALLWSECDDNYTPLGQTDRQLAPEALAECRGDCARFLSMNAMDLTRYEISGGFPMPSEHAGHDFLLTRNGHGTGFWDRGLDELGDRLTVAAGRFDVVHAYVGDDGLIYI